MAEYLTAPELEAALPTSSQADSTLVAIAIKGASRSIDSYCGQRFWTDTAVGVRQYYPDASQMLRIDPIADTTGLIVQTDPGGDGTFATSLTLTTDFILLPVNAADQSPAQPYTQIWLPSSSFPWSVNGRPSVQVTALFGWPSVPDDVHAAAILLARDLFKELKDAPFGVAGTAEFGVLRIRQNATALSLLARYRRPLVA